MSNTKSTAADADQQLDQSTLRKKSRAARTAMTANERHAASLRIADTVVHSSWFRRATLLACYLPTEEEVDTWLIIERAWRMKKRIFAPVIEKKSVMQFRELTPESDLLTSQFGLSEPRDGKTIDPRELDLVITPGIAFDTIGNRIGMGGGYFDRTFSFLKHRKILLHPKLIGVAFACQRVDKIAANPWDVRVFSVIDETTAKTNLGSNQE